MASETSRRYNVVASYADMEGARRAIDALQFSGIDAVDISLLGERAHEAADRANSERNTTSRDQPMVMRILGRAVRWGIAGAAIGALLGLVLWALGVQFARIGDSAAVTIGSWALFGLIGGTLIGAMSAISNSEAWALTFEPVDEGNVLVGVHSEQDRDAEHAVEILRSKEPLSVSRFGPDGRPLRA